MALVAGTVTSLAMGDAFSEPRTVHFASVQNTGLAEPTEPSLRRRQLRAMQGAFHEKCAWPRSS